MRATTRCSPGTPIRSATSPGEARPIRTGSSCAEVMLQQTQAARVVPFYNRFIIAFPTAADLASAVLQDVLDAWSGLGYNARALRLREAARIVARRRLADDARNPRGSPRRRSVHGLGDRLICVWGTGPRNRYESPACAEPLARRVAQRGRAVCGGEGRTRRTGERLESGNDGSRRHTMHAEEPELRGVPRPTLVRGPGGIRSAHRAGTV